MSEEETPLPEPAFLTTVRRETEQGGGLGGFRDRGARRQVGVRCAHRHHDRSYHAKRLLHAGSPTEQKPARACHGAVAVGGW